MMAQDLYITAEVEYRRTRATQAYGRPADGRHRVRRRPSLHLPRPRRRPLSLA